LHVISVTKTDVMLERTGEVYPIEELPNVIVAEDSSIIVAEEMGRVILRLNDAFKDSKTFQYKLTPIYRDAHPVNGKVKSRAVLRDTTTSLVGFPGHYHHPIDPVSFIRFSVNEFDKRDLPKLNKLMDWGMEVRNFCIENDLLFKPSAGGIAAQLLRDPRFYPKARRKVPKIINAKGRKRLPGNFYQLYGETERRYSASYVDMQGAHHFIAQRVKFPCANTLKAYGQFSTEKPTVWARPNSKRLRGVMSWHGLFHVKLSVPAIGKGRFAPPYMEKQGQFDVWIFSNELPMIRALGGRVEAVYAVLGSPDVDEGLSKYAQWAVKQLDERADQKGWLKPLLHSPYGVLAARPRPMEFGWRIAKGGEADVYPMAGKVVPVKVLKTKRIIEGNTANVIHRAMIEAEQRMMALTLAQELSDKGGKVICIYADSLFVNMPQLPLLPEPWVLKEQVTNLRFLSATQFMSPQITRLPGVPSDLQGGYSPAGRTARFRPKGEVSCASKSITQQKEDIKIWLRDSQISS
jgi:hypothetical protein